MIAGLAGLTALIPPIIISPIYSVISIIITSMVRTDGSVAYRRVEMFKMSSSFQAYVQLRILTNDCSTTIGTFNRLRLWFVLFTFCSVS